MNSPMKKTIEAWGLRWSRTRERGATAIVIALSMVIIMGAAALSFDSANLALQRQSLRNLVDASAQAGASYLPGDPAGAVAAAIEYAHRYDSTFTPTTSLWCVIGSTGATMQPAAGFIPATCNPGGSGTYTNGVNGVVCDTILCAIPCLLTGTNPRCNTMKVDGNKDVPYYFAPAIGIPNGNTGAVTSVSCKGSCGTLMPNAMDIAFVADRTSSLDSTVFGNMKQGIKDTLSTMTPEYQFVTLGTIHKSATSGTCKTNLAAYNANPTADGAARTGSWTPLNFSNDYLTGSLGSVSRSLNTTSDLVSNVTCMNQASQPWGTHLAAPLKAAARMLLGYQTSNLSTLQTARKALLPPGTVVKKAIIMETDGVPEETIGFNGLLNGNGSQNYVATDKSLGSTSLTDATDPVAGSPWYGDVGCANLLAVANAAKAAGITVIMIGYGDANTAKCKKNYSNGTFSGNNVDDTLASAASNGLNGLPSLADHDCSTAAGAAAENSDNDNYFCAATGAQLSGIFATAVSQLTATTKFVKMPGS